jgi:multiple sugar transport system ATP-binding protein
VLGDPPQAAAWQPWRERAVVLGIRPEHLQPQDTGAAFSAQLEVLEPVGNEIFLNLRHGAQALVSRVSPRVLPEPGSTLSLGLVAERLHLFDAVSGQRIGA